MAIEVKDERGKLIYSSDPKANPAPAKAVVRLKERDVPMIAKRKFRAPGTGGNVWPGDPFLLHAGEVDEFERRGLARRDLKPKEETVPADDEQIEDPPAQKPSRHKVSKPSKRKG